MAAASCLREAPTLAMVETCIREVMPDDEIILRPDRHLGRDLGFGSLDKLDLCFHLEKALGLGRFADNSVWDEDPTVGELLSALTEATA